MNPNNTLKRRRPFGHEPDGGDVLFQQQGAAAYSPVDLDFASLPLAHRTHLDQVAYFYGLNAFQLHTLLYNYAANGSSVELSPQSPKRPRISPGYPMAPPSSAHGLDRSDPDRISQHGLEPGESGSGFNGSYPLDLDGGSRLANGLANLKVVLCQNCLTRCDGQDNYDPLPGPPSYNYDPGRPYTMEKPPTLAVTQPEEFSPLKGPEASSFLDDGTQSTRYLPTYPSLQPAQSTVTQPGNGEQLAYANAPLPEYYNETQLPGSLPLGSDAARPTPFMEEQAMNAAVVSSAPFSDSMSLHRSANELDGGASRYSMVPAYGGRASAMVGSGSDPAMLYQDSRYDVMVSNPMNRPAARRGPFKNTADREKTAHTRKIGSCVRCRMQRIRCQINPSEPGGPCLTCQKVASNTKIRRLPCLRYKITDVRLFKPGQVRGFEWTRRWRENIVDNISNWASDDIKIIKVSEGYTSRPVELRVRRFIPQDGDKLDRTWVVNGAKKSVAIPPYAIVDLEAARKAYSEHIDRGIVECFKAVLKPHHDLLWRTYALAWKMSQDPAASADERELLLLTLRLWVAVRLTTKSTIIVGPETLGMSANIMDETSPNHGTIPLPPVMGAQLDMILIHQIQVALRRDLLDKLQKMIQTNKQKTWLTSYLVTFILLHNIALITDHDASYARKHGMKTRFAREEKVREYHMGANILLAYFHYCNKGIYPFSNECKEQDLRTLAELDDGMMAFVKETRDYVAKHRVQWQRLQQDGSFEDDYFFVSQLFMENWEPRSTI